MDTGASSGHDATSDADALDTGLYVTKTPSASGGAHVRIQSAHAQVAHAEVAHARVAEPPQSGRASQSSLRQTTQPPVPSSVHAQAARAEAAHAQVAESPQSGRASQSSLRQSTHPPAPRQARQRYIAGTAVSHLFLAAGGRVRSIGFNTLWPSTHADGFAYGGAINRAILSAAQRERIMRATERLAQHLDLRGINSLDFVLCGAQEYCLELNPRPSATMQLYEPDAPGYLFAAHIDACRGVLPSPPPATQSRPRAHAVIYALTDTVAQPALRDIAGLRDFSIGQAVAAGAPLCSVVVDGARDESIAQVLSRLQSNIRRIRRIQDGGFGDDFDADSQTGFQQETQA